MFNDVLRCIFFPLVIELSNLAVFIVSVNAEVALHIGNAVFVMSVDAKVTLHGGNTVFIVSINT